MRVEQQVSGCHSGAPSGVVVTNYEDSGVGTSSLAPGTPHPAVKKQTRQWAAWTRQEAESFFNALRQVGKNFEKITNCVRSKNKDQVRHYYYRLVRRMNKLLGPELCLDPKNSKVTNSAMLRWWSLLEKYSCKPSALHLKPRRYKMFVETLENQLLRDNRKYIRRLPSPSEHNSSSVPNIASNHDQPLNQDSHEVKELPDVTQRIHKNGTEKGSSVKSDTHMGASHANCKSDMSAVRTPRQRRKIDVSSTDAYKSWEKAAISGVSLVADAAEHLERSTDKEVENDREVLVQKGVQGLRENILRFPSTSLNSFTETNVQDSVKLKLQLFPMDESTRTTLEMENYNPHLELTLSTRKKISSVMEHLHRKWGNSSVAHGELMLLPYSSPNESLASCQKWNKYCNFNASDVHALVGSPPLFRLRYGWFSNFELGTGCCESPIFSTPSTIEGCNPNIDHQTEQIFDLLSISNQLNQDESKKTSELIKHQQHPITKPISHTEPLESGMDGCIPTMGSSVNILGCPDNVSSLSLPRTNSYLDSAMKLVENSVGGIRTDRHGASSATNWADSLTNISVGELLSQVSRDGHGPCSSSHVHLSSRSLQQPSFSPDSFDAAIAAHIHNYQSKAVDQSTPPCHTSSIWDAEEARDEFTFQKTSPLAENIPAVYKNNSLQISEQISKPSFVATDAMAEEVHCHREFLPDDLPHEDLVDELHSGSSAKDLGSYWPDSLGAFDFGIPSSRYHSEDLIISNSLWGLSGLIASSLDAFQNCSFFMSDKKEPESIVQARESGPVTEYKIGTEV